MDTASDVITFVLTLILIILSALYFYYRRPTSFPPGPTIIKGIGTLPFIRTTGNYRELIQLVADWKSRFGKIVGYSTGDDYAIVINDYQLAWELLIKNGKYVSNRPITDRTKIANPFYPKKGIMDGNFTDAGWLHLHQAGQMALHNFVEMPPRGRCTNRLEGRLSRHLDSLLASIRPAPPEHQTDTRRGISLTFVKVIYSLLFGCDIKASKKMLGLSASLDMLCSFAPNSPLLKNNKLIRCFDNPNGQTAMMKDVYKSFQSFVFEAIGERQTRKKKDQQESHDFINYYMREYEKAVGQKEGDNRAVLVTSEILEHGVDPLTSTAGWVLYHMVGNPEIQARIQEELDTVVGNKRHPKLKDRSSLGLIDAVISETLRLTPPFPVGLARSTSSKVQADKYVLPRNTTVFLNIWHIHRDSEIWNEPETFNPARFLNASGRHVNRQELIPFGLGRRICFGEQTARQALFLVVANLLHKFSFRLQDGSLLPEPLSCDDAAAATLRPPKMALTTEARM